MTQKESSETKLHLQQWQFLIATTLLLLIIACRMSLIRQVELNSDEVWSVWQTFGTPQQIVAWTSFDAPPLYFLMLGTWRGVFGFHPFILRFSSVLISILGIVFVYRLACQMSNKRFALVAALSYAALGMHIFFSIYVRAYIVLLTLLPLSLWLTIRYFEHPTLRRAILLALCLAVMFYLHLTAGIAIAILGFYTLLVYKWSIWRWWLPGSIAVLLVIPELSAKLQLSITRVESISQEPPPPFLESIIAVFRDYMGNAYPVWVALIALAVILLVFSYRRWNTTTLVLVLWALGGPILLYVLNPILGFFINPKLGFFAAQYSWWVMLGIALLVGKGLSYLSSNATLGAASIVLLGVMLYPLPLERYGLPTRPFYENFRWLSERIRSGDAILIDPNCDCGAVYDWDYYTRLFFPNGDVKFVTDPSQYQRVWYVKQDGWQDKGTEDAILKNRVPSMFVGPWNFLFRLYEAPPDTEGILFENGLRFHGAQALDEFGQPTSRLLVVPEGSNIRLRLWWSIDKPLSANYSISLQYLNGDDLVAQTDGSPQLVSLDLQSLDPLPTEMTQWIPESYYVEERTLILPYPMSHHEAMIYLTVYQWWDNQRLTAPGVDANKLLPVQRLIVAAW